MARVDFYVLKAAGEPARLQFACRLTEKVYKLKNSIHILVADPATAERLNELLWSWREGSFVPHEVIPAQSGAPVTLGSSVDDVPENVDLLINLSDIVLEDIDTFLRVAEIVTSDEATLRASRERYSSYREHGHTLETHNV